MLQITIFLLCIYLVFKGKELLMLADLSAPEVREEAKRSALKCYRGAFVVAIIFALWALTQGSAMPGPRI